MSAYKEKHVTLGENSINLVSYFLCKIHKISSIS